LLFVVSLSPVTNNYVQKKTKKQEYLPIPQKAVEFLPERGKDTDSVFNLRHGKYKQT